MKKLIDRTIMTCYTTFPSKFRQHWVEENDPQKHLLTEATEGYSLIIASNRQMIGTGTLLHDKIKRVFIHPDYQRKGYGTLIMQKLEQQARANAIDTIRLSATSPSKPFFERLGYKLISEHKFKDESLKQFRYYRMEKEI
ncbi:MAG: GNAT family N-acetyltransferase [Candidatus Bathyarchaeota archaeon]|nr:MAG: GNAT family N-acetyltransferase [Candidatus Bathyarchaeota archaeon]